MLQVSERLLCIMREASLEVLVASSPFNVRYVTGYDSLGQRILPATRVYAVVTTTGARFLILPTSEAAAAAETVSDEVEILCYGTFYYAGCAEPGFPARVLQAVRSAAASYREALMRCLHALGAEGKAVGFDDPSPPERSLLEGLNCEVVCADAVFMRARSIKTSSEQNFLIRAASISEEAIRAAVSAAGEGITEREFASLIEMEVVRRGAEPAFTVVTFGQRSAYVDISPSSSRRLCRAEPVRIDIGCRYQGYASDIARTAVLGIAPTWLEKAYRAVYAGEDAAIKASRPGLSTGELFEIAVNTTRTSGLPDFTRHHCGHGIGLSVYEPPLVSAGHTAPLNEGMVLCVETPYYHLNQGGVQVEDMILITPDGHRRLTGPAPGLLRIGESQ